MSVPLEKVDSVDQKLEYAHDEDMSVRNEPGVVSANAVTMPQSLVGMSTDEMATLAKASLRKTDLLVMPVMVFLYILNYLDRQNIAAAKLAGIEKDLGLSLTQYQTCVSILFAGYIAFQIPSNMIMGKIQYPAYYICLACALWGAVSACTGAVQGYVGLVICRCMLGITEAVFFPAALFYLSCWYSKKQLAFRIAILYSGSQAGNAFGGLLAIAILKLDGAHGIEGWRWLFIVEGIATVICAFIIVLILPNKPENAKRFSQEQRDYIAYTLEREKGQKDDSASMSVWTGLAQATLDPKTWMLLGILFSTYVSAAVTNFFPSVVGTLGYSRNITYCLTAPPYLLCIAVILLNGLHSDKTQERYLHIVCPLFVTLIANIIAVSTLNTAGRYVAMMLMPGSFYASSIVTLSWISTATTGNALKRAIVMALINSCANLPNIFTSYLYKAPPRYLNAFLVNLAAAGVAIAFATLLRLYLRRQNAKLERGEAMPKSGPTEAQQAQGFRYPL